MTTQEVANRLVALCREGNYVQVFKELYAEDARSIEPEGSMMGTVQGLEAFQQKAEQWQGMISEVHSNNVSDPIVAENFFAVTMATEVTMKGMNERTLMEEVCVYNVVDGKVTSEQFFYTPLPEFA